MYKSLHYYSVTGCSITLSILMQYIFNSKNCKSVVATFNIQHNTLPLMDTKKKTFTLFKLSNNRQEDMLGQYLKPYTLIHGLFLSAVLNNTLRSKMPPHQRFMYYFILLRHTASFIQHNNNKQYIIREENRVQHTQNASFLS